MQFTSLYIKIKNMLNLSITGKHKEMKNSLFIKSGEIHLGNFQCIGYFEQEYRQDNQNTCIEE